jgi:L-amino acid N-acyltransferase YncA
MNAAAGLPPLLIRDVTEGDAAAIVAILNPIIEAGTFTALDTPFSVEAETAFIKAFPARGIWKVAERSTDTRIVGFQVVEPFATYTRAFDHVGTFGTYVDLGCRRQGIAHALFAATFAAAPAQGYEKFFTFVRADNHAALRTYLAHGFVQVGTARRQARIRGEYVDEILIERQLGGPDGDVG